MSFRKRAGYAWTDEDRAYEDEFSNAMLDLYRDMGATSIVVPYAKGFGLRVTAGELERERDVIRRAHARGLRVATYVRVDAIVPETMRGEQPGVDAWVARGMHGRPSVYHAQQTFRHRICYSHPGAVGHLEHILRHAVESLGADQLHLDGYHVSSSPATGCRCDLCLASYRRWLKITFPDQCGIEAYFGIANIDEIDPPLVEPGSPLPLVVRSPDMRAWLRFQWERELAFTRHVRRFVRSVSGEVAVSINPHLGVFDNAPLRHAQHAQALLPWVDAVWTEDRFTLGVRDGQTVSRLAAFKLAREADLPLCTYHWAARPGRVAASMGLTIAANGGHSSCLGFTFRYLPHVRLAEAVKQRMTAWARAHWPLLGNTRPWGEVGLLRHHESMTWNGAHPWRAAAACEALLTRMGVPWRMLDRVEHPALDEVGTLIAPDAESMGDADVERLRSWVGAGGRLLVTARTAAYDQDRRRRPVHPIRAWLKPDAPPGPEAWFEWLTQDAYELLDMTDDPPAADAGMPTISDLDRGKVGCWPRLQPASDPQPHELHRGDLRPPADAAPLAAFLRALHGPFAVSVDAPANVIVEFNRARRTRDRLVHLVRADDHDEPADALIHLSSPLTAASVTCLSPDARPPRLAVAGDDIHLQGLDRYAVVHLHDA